MREKASNLKEVKKGDRTRIWAVSIRFKAAFNRCRKQIFNATH